jgi:hypothetical protein
MNTSLVRTYPTHPHHHLQLLAIVAMASLPTAWAAPADRPMPEPPTGPILTFESTVFDFGKVDSGGSITHAFVFRNTGDQVLEITRVQPGCGCTTAGTWDKRVEPGAKGSIPLQFNATGFSGRVTKTATVHSNDRNHSNVVLQLTGTVWKPVEATPSLVMFSYTEEGQTPQTRNVRILNHLEEAVTISGIEGTNASFQAVLETIRPGHEYQLNLTARPPFTQRSTVAPIRLTTSAQKVPSVQVTAYALVQPLVAVSPEQLWIPEDAPASPIKSTLVIRNSGAEPVKLSEPKATIDGPEVVLRESEAGRLYHVDVTFPAGFRLEEGRPVEITVRSSHPKFPLLRIPVLQQPGIRSRKPSDS